MTNFYYDTNTPLKESLTKEEENVFHMYIYEGCARTESDGYGACVFQLPFTHELVKELVKAYEDHTSYTYVRVQNYPDPCSSLMLAWESRTAGSQRIGASNAGTNFKLNEDDNFLVYDPQMWDDFLEYKLGLKLEEES